LLTLRTNIFDGWIRVKVPTYKFIEIDPLLIKPTSEKAFAVVARAERRDEAVSES